MGSCCSRRTSKKIFLLLVGLDNAGKTTALRGLAGESTEHMLPSVGFSCTSLKYKCHTVTIFDLGGSSGIRGIWDKYFTDVHGVIFVVDASATNRLEECRQALQLLLQHDKLAGKPVLLLANKQDLPGALDEIDLVEKLGLETLVNRQKCRTSVETCAAVLSPDPAIQNGYKWLLETVLQDFEQLDSRVCADVAAQRLEEDKMREERLQRVQKLREKCQNGHAQEDDEEDYHTNPFRPISEITGDKHVPQGTKMIIVSPPVTSPTGSVDHLISDDKPKNKSLFRRNNKTAPLPETSPVRKLPPLKQAPIVTNNETVPWIKPVLSTDERAGSERAWGLQEALEPIVPETLP